MNYDIAIIGLGPAGATVTRMLADKYKIIAIDKKQEINSKFQKPCGGLLSEDAQKSLSKFNLTLPKDVLVDPQIFAVKTIDIEQNLVRHYQRFYINLDRHKFDLWLISLIPKSVQIEKNSVCNKISKEDGKYLIQYKQDGVEKKITARYIIGADGANSIVRRFLYPDKKIREYISVQEWFHDKNPLAFYSCVFDSRLTDCYAWSISKDGVFIFGGAFHQKNWKRNFALMKKNLEEKGFIFGDLIKTEACKVLRPSKFSDFCLGRENAFIIGEAAGFISPSSLEGFSYAFDSAYALAESLLQEKKKPNNEYRKRTLRIRLKLILKILKVPFMYKPFLRKLVLKSKIKAISVMEQR